MNEKQTNDPTGLNQGIGQDGIEANPLSQITEKDLGSHETISEDLIDEGLDNVNVDDALDPAEQNPSLDKSIESQDTEKSPTTEKAPPGVLFTLIGVLIILIVLLIFGIRFLRKTLNDFQVTETPTSSLLDMSLPITKR